jgi:LytS/YehU family sensor histidine kinase
VMLAPAAPLGYLIGMPLGGWLTDHPTPLAWVGSAATGAVLATLLASALAGLLLWTHQRIRGEEAARAHAQRLAAEAELRLLRAQLEPHMLFNTLANLRELVADDPRAAQTMLDSLIVFLRHTLMATRQERTTLEQEFSHLQAYLSLMAVRMGARLQWHVDLPESLRAAVLPPMLLQPLVENAVQHGVESQPGPGAIRVAAFREGDAIVVTVADTGRGLRSGGVTGEMPRLGAPPAARPGSSSYGLTHVRERLHAEYGARAGLELASNPPHGVLARVRFPG